MPRGKTTAALSSRPQAKPLILTPVRRSMPLRITTRVAEANDTAATQPTSITIVPLLKTPAFKHTVSNLAALSDLINNIPENSLIVSDLDNTLMEPAQLVGSDQWFEAYLKHTKDIQQTLRAYNYVHERSTVTAVEPSTVKFVNDLKQKHNVLGLTTRGRELADATIRQLDSLGIRFAPRGSNEVHLHKIMQDCPDSSAIDGIIFAGGRSKGKCLEAYFHAMQINVKNIPHLVFIDDKSGHVDNVSAMAERLGIPSTCIRYAHLDHKIPSVHLPTAAVQLSLFANFNRFLSDAEAKEIATRLNTHGIIEPAKTEFVPVDVLTIKSANSSTTTTTDNNERSTKRVRLT